MSVAQPPQVAAHAQRAADFLWTLQPATTEPTTDDEQQDQLFRANQPNPLGPPPWVRVDAKPNLNSDPAECF